MSFSFSTFTVEIDGVPTISFRAKWYAEAEDICRGWANLNWDEMVANDPASSRRARSAGSWGMRQQKINFQNARIRHALLVPLLFVHDFEW
jgi:hypothetical protein